VNDDVCATIDAAQKNVVIISSTVVSGKVADKYAYLEVPVIGWEPDVWDDMNMVYWSNRWGAGTVADQSQLEIINSTHPLAAGKSGTVTVTTDQFGDAFHWGFTSQEATGAIPIARIVGDNSKYGIFAYDRGGVMENGFNAPGRRVGFYLNDFFASSTLSADGKALFDAAVDWCLAGYPASETPNAARAWSFYP
jgi:hypothetical protein